MRTANHTRAALVLALPLLLSAPRQARAEGGPEQEPYYAAASSAPAPSVMVYSPPAPAPVPYAQPGPPLPPVMLCAPPVPALRSGGADYLPHPEPYEDPYSYYYGSSRLLVDSINHAISERFQGLAKGFDRWLAKSTYTVENPSNLDLRLTADLKEYQQYKVMPRVYFSVKLPMTDSKVKLMVKHLQKGKETFTDSQERIAQGHAAGGGTTVGGKTDIALSGRLRLEMDGGVKTSLRPGHFVRLYASAGIGHEMVFGNCNSRLFAQAGWYSQPWIEVSGGALLNIALPKKALLSINNTAESPTTISNISIYQSVGYTKQIGKMDSYGVSVGLHANTRPAVRPDTYFLGLNYRRNLHNYWIYGELSPELSFPSDRNYRAVPGLYLKLSMYFGRRD